MFPHNLAVSPSNVEYLEKAYSCVRRKLGRPQNDEMEQINTNAEIWDFYVFVNEGSGSTKKIYVLPSKINPLFNVTRKLIQDQEHEIDGISTIEIQWMRSTLLHEDVVKLSTAKVYVFSDSVPCLGGRVAEYPQSVQSCKNRIELFSQNPQYRGLDNISGEQVVFEWEIFLRTHHAEVTPGSPKTWWRKKAFSR